MKQSLNGRPRFANTGYLVNWQEMKVRPNTPEAIELFGRWGYKDVVLDAVHPDAILKDSCLIHRYRGGLGDILTMKPGIKNLVELGEWRVTLALQDIYLWMFKDIPNLRLVDYANLFRGTKSYGYHKVRELYGMAIDMFCPAGLHEDDTKNRPTIGRIDIFANTLQPPGYAPVVGEACLKPVDLSQFDWVGKQPVVGMQIESERMEKDWPLTKYSELAKLLSDRGITPVTFHPKIGIENAESVTGFALDEVAYLIKHTVDFMVGPDSGLLHLAQALGKPTLWLFGPTDSKTTLKYYEKAEAIQYYESEDTKCHRPCYYNKEHNNFFCHNIHGYCMLDIQVKEVFENIMGRINGN